VHNVARFSNETISKATYANLISYCQAKGIEVKREGREYVIKANDSIYISAQEPYKWYRHSTGVGGKAIDFCVKYLGMKFTQAVTELSGDLPTVEIAPTTYYEPNMATDQKRVIAYLSKKRGIAYSTVTALIRNGSLRQDTKGNCIFIIRDFEGHKVGGELHGTGDTRFKGQLNQQDGFGFSILLGEPKQVAYFESSIDLLSFKQLYPTKSNVLLVSMGGLKSVVVETYREHFPFAEHIICCDSDEKGKLFCEGQALRSCHPPTPFKDWNDYLKGKQSIGKK